MRSPLSSTQLVHRAFFSPTYSIEKVRAFEVEMAPYESMSWPSGMMLPFVSCARVLSNLLATSSQPASGSKSHVPLLVISGAQDMLMRDPLMKRMTNMYASAGVGIGYNFKFRDVSKLQYELISKAQNSGEASKREVWFAEITAPGAGHNLMRDDGWERCAKVVESFLDS
ncbi:alpha/beta hydrolase family protein [Ceratobasidium sp. AG-Ba]|nr:alpha/beta hydrolase family protein [Ceratobasidium sp. AG-Ba]